MIRKRHVIQPKSELSIKNGEQVIINRNNNPFMFITCLDNKINYGPVNDKGQPVISESLRFEKSQGMVAVNKIIELNKEHKISFIKTELNK